MSTRACCRAAARRSQWRISSPSWTTQWRGYGPSSRPPPLRARASGLPSSARRSRAAQVSSPGTISASSAASGSGSRKISSSWTSSTTRWTQAALAACSYQGSCAASGRRASRTPLPLRSRPPGLRAGRTGHHASQRRRRLWRRAACQAAPRRRRRGTTATIARARTCSNSERRRNCRAPCTRCAHGSRALRTRWAAGTGPSSSTSKTGTSRAPSAGRSSAPCAARC